MGFLFDQPLGDEVALEETAAGIALGLAAAWPDAASLRALTADHGSDLATAVARRLFENDAVNARFLARLIALPPRAAPAARPTTVAIVPTMYWRERPELGGDGRLIGDIARRFGARVESIAVGSLGRIDDNAELVIRWFEDYAGPAPWLVTISKGTADAKRAFVRRPDLAARLAGWISLAGMPGGTPLAEARPGRPVAHALLKGWLALRGASPGMLAEMSPRHEFSLAPLALPPAVEVVNLVPMPLSHHLRRPVERSAAWLGRSGPNDGYVLLEHALLPGRVIPVWGADHYLRVPAFAGWIYRIVAHACGIA